MSRFIQESFGNKPEKEAKPAPKFGNGSANRQTDYSKLAENKKIPTKGGYK